MSLEGFLYSYLEKLIHLVKEQVGHQKGLELIFDRYKPFIQNSWVREFQKVRFPLTVSKYAQVGEFHSVYSVRQFQTANYYITNWSATVMTPLGKINKPRNDLRRLKANETFIWTFRNLIFFSIWSFTVRTIFHILWKFDNSEYFLSNFSEGVPASVLRHTSVDVSIRWETQLISWELR